MAYSPHKRRKLSDSTAEHITHMYHNTNPSEPPFFHRIEHIQAFASPQPVSPSHDPGQARQDHQNMAVGGSGGPYPLHPRQDSAVAAFNVVASISDSASTSITISQPTTEATPTNTNSTAELNASRSSVDSTVVRTNVSITSSSAIAPLSLTTTASLLSSNSTSTSTVATNLSPTTVLTTAGNHTTSVVLLKGDNATTSTTAVVTSSTGSSSTDSACSFALTLSNGEVSTICRSDSLYTTTLSDGEIFTIPSIPLSTTGPVSSPSDVTSTTIITSSMQGHGGQQSTITAFGSGTGNTTPSSSSATTSSTAVAAGGNTEDNTPPPGTIAGGVVGGAAGLAVVLLIAMLLVRWWRRKGSMQAIPQGSIASREADGTSEFRSPGMAERAGLMPLFAAMPTILRHQNRSVEASAPSERGFTRISGRKLPSAFSEGMSSEDMANQRTTWSQAPAMPMSGSLPENDDSNPFDQDHSGFYTGDRDSGPSPTSHSDNSTLRTSPAETMTMSRGPQRQPRVHSGGPYVMSLTGASPAYAPAQSSATSGRNDTSANLRNSRFTEDM